MQNSSVILRPTVFIDTLKNQSLTEEYKKEAVKSRMKEVRKQEAELSKQLVKQKEIVDKQRMEEEETRRKFEEYMKKKDLIENLNKLKAERLEEIGIH